VINKPAHGELHFLPALNFSQSGIIFVGIVQFQNEIQMNYLQFLLVELQPLPELDLPVNLADAPERGWRKLTIFKRGFGGLQVSPRYSLLSKTTLRNISGFLINKSGFKLYQY
jgi:hypothetical protein